MRTFGRSGCGLLLLACSPLAVAHQDLSAGELEDYHKNLKRNGEALSRCLESPEMREHNARMLVHHDDTLRSIRKARGMDTELGTSALALVYFTLTDSIRHREA
jgi:hypothetical protein